MSHSSLDHPTPERNLRAWAWLPLEKWNPENLFADHDVNNKRICQVCDGWFFRSESKTHCQEHVREEEARRERIKEETRARKEAEENAQRAIAGLPPKSHKNTSRSPRKRGGRSEVVQIISEALKNSGEATLASLSDSTGLDIALVRTQIKNVSGAVIVGQVKSGQRGRPAAIYGMK